MVPSKMIYTGNTSLIHKIFNYYFKIIDYIKKYKIKNMNNFLSYQTYY